MLGSTGIAESIPNISAQALFAKRYAQGKGDRVPEIMSIKLSFFLPL